MPNLPRVVLFQFYAFDAGVLAPEYFDQLKAQLDKAPALWTQTCTASLCLPTPVNKDKVILSSFFKFDNSNLYPEFRDLSRTQHYALPGFAISGDALAQYLERDGVVDVCLTLHRSGVGTVVFHPPAFVNCPGETLKTIAVEFHQSRFQLTPAPDLLKLAAHKRSPVPAEASLDTMLLYYLSTCLDQSVLSRNGVDPKSSDPLAVSTVNRYQLLSVEDVPREYDDIDDFVTLHRTELVDTAQAFSWHAGREYSYSASRRPKLAEALFSPETSARRHLVYELNSFRLIAVSALHSHPEIYGYKDNRWYKSFLGMIDLGLSQMQAVYLLHGALWRRLQTKEELLSLQEASYAALLDFHNARVINHPRGRLFLKKLTSALHVDEYYEAVRDRLALAQSIATERHERRERQRADGFQVVGYVLSLILSLDFAATFQATFLDGLIPTAAVGVAGARLLVRLIVFLLWIVVMMICMTLYRRLSQKVSSEE